LNPRDFLNTASDLVESASNRPRQTNLRRAVSTTYYALFHVLAKCCADLLIGGKGSDRSRFAWYQVYRSLEHGNAKRSCDHKRVSKFPQEIQDFANAFVSMQAKRHKADYDPHERIYKSAVLFDIELAKDVMDKFKHVSLKDRRAFAAYVLLKVRDEDSSSSPKTES
jgi:uncharacterized protein (UPF0332 family)